MFFYFLFVWCDLNYFYLGYFFFLVSFPSSLLPVSLSCTAASWFSSFEVIPVKISTQNSGVFQLRGWMDPEKEPSKLLTSDVARRLNERAWTWGTLVGKKECLSLFFTKGPAVIKAFCVLCSYTKTTVLLLRSSESGLVCGRATREPLAFWLLVFKRSLPLCCFHIDE